MRAFLVLTCLALALLCIGCQEEPKTNAVTSSPITVPVKMTVDLDAACHQMEGGIGASWHAMSREFTFSKLTNRIQQDARGSAWGGNPPIEDKDAWHRVGEMASWLGINWIRVELEQRMYEPQRNRFDWDNEEMQALYRILDWCEQNKADVFLTQMWSFVEWNSYEGVPPLQSAPKSMDDFAVGLATLVEYLVKEKQYTCIKWVCISNEPSGEWSWWLGPDNKLLSITPGLKAVRTQLDKHQIQIPLSGPDYHHLGGPEEGGYNFQKYIGAFDCHNYEGTQADAMERWATFAHSHNKPFFLSEMGDMRCGWGGSNPGPSTYKHSLSVANTVLAGLNANVDAFNRWSFTNRGDLDGQWQLIRTWDRTNKKHLKTHEIMPETIPFYSYGIMTRFWAKNSAILKSTTSDSKVLFAALRSKKGNLTFIVLNKHEAYQEINLNIKGITALTTLHCYQVTESEILISDFKLDAKKNFHISSTNQTFKDSLPPLSINVYSTYNLKHSDVGIMTDE